MRFENSIGRFLRGSRNLCETNYRPLHGYCVFAFYETATVPILRKREPRGGLVVHSLKNLARITNLQGESSSRMQFVEEEGDEALFCVRDV